MKTGCLIDVSEMTIPFSFSGGDMSYPSFLLQVPIVMRITGYATWHPIRDVQRSAKVARQM